MWFYNLGAAEWGETQAIVCALARLKREATVLSYPQSPCLCMAGPAHLDQEVDLALLRARGTPIFHRATRERVMCCAQAQLELQVVLAGERHRLLQAGNVRFRTALLPLLNACRDLQLDASFRPPNEIVVRGRRLASACIGEFSQCTIVAASLALEFDADPWGPVLNVQTEGLRARLVELLHLHRTSLREELGALPTLSQLERLIEHHTSLALGELQPVDADPLLAAYLRDSAAAAFAFRGDETEPPSTSWKIDLGAGAELQQCTYKAPGGFLRAICEWKEGRITRASLSGDFFCYPPGGLFRLERALVGLRADQVAGQLAEFYRELGLVTPGIRANHWARVLAPTPIAS